MRYCVSISVLLAGLLVNFLVLIPQMWEHQSALRSEISAGYVIPSKFSRVLALGQQGLMSDYLFLKVSTFVGSRGVADHEMSEADWDYVEQGLNVVTDLDPYFADPYMLGEGLFAWDAGRLDAANKLLEKGLAYRSKDWRLPFYIGFNHFYFNKDFKTGSTYVMRAAELPGSPAYLKSLGARLAYYGGKSKTALLFLKEMLAESDDSILKQRLSLRLTALERAVMIEDALRKYRDHYGVLPSSLDELISSGYLLLLPEDPYGGKWGILKNGRVFSTSKFVETKTKK